MEPQFLPEFLLIIHTNQVNPCFSFLSFIRINFMFLIWNTTFCKSNGEFHICNRKWIRKYPPRVNTMCNFPPPIKQLLAALADLQIISKCFSTSFYLLTLCKVNSWTACDCYIRDVLFKNFIVENGCQKYKLYDVWLYLYKLCSLKTNKNFSLCGMYNNV